VRDALALPLPVRGHVLPALPQLVVEGVLLLELVNQSGERALDGTPNKVVACSFGINQIRVNEAKLIFFYLLDNA